MERRLHKRNTGYQFYAKDVTLHICIGIIILMLKITSYHLYILKSLT